MITGAVFDMDGLMFDTERLVYETWQAMMDEKGYKYSLEIFKNTIGLRADASKAYYLSLFGNNFEYDSFKSRSRIIFMKRVENEGVPLKKGLIELLEFLKVQQFKISLATSTTSQTALKLLKMSGVYDFFDTFVCGDDVKNGKPHPEVFLTAAAKLGLLPENCVAFEDSINGIKSAFAANMKTVMVPDYLPPTEEIKPMIGYLCSDLSQAINYIRKENKL